MKFSQEVAQAWLEWVYHEDLQSFLRITWGGNTLTVFSDSTSTDYLLSVHLWISFMYFLSSFPRGVASKNPPRAYRIYTVPLETMIWYRGNFLKMVYFPSDPYTATKLTVLSEVIGIPLKKLLPQSAKILREKREGLTGNWSILELTCCDPRHAFIWKAKNQVPSQVRSNMMA